MILLLPIIPAALIAVTASYLPAPWLGAIIYICIVAGMTN